MKVEKHPLDFDALARGDKISSERVERALNVARDHRNYHLYQMRLGKEIATNFFNTRNDRVIVRCCGDSLHILTFDEQAEYASSTAGAHLLGHERMVDNVAAVLHAILSDAVREAAERFLYVAAFQLQQLRKKPPPRLTNNDTPKEIN